MNVQIRFVVDECSNIRFVVVSVQIRFVVDECSNIRFVVDECSN